MSKREALIRYSAIIKTLKKKPSTLKEIDQELALQSDLHEYNLKISKRTFQRDVEDISALFQIHIEYDFSQKKYRITNQEDENLSNRILDAFNTLHALNSSVGYSEHIDLEQRKTAGNDHFYGILHAIKNKLELEINYQSYWHDTATLKTVQPYLLKEFKNRWYLIANDKLKNELRTYGLDRIQAINFSKKRFSIPASFIPKTHFKHSFGIIRKDSELPVQTVILAFDAHQGKYIKSLPLHNSQEVVTENEAELVIKLRIYVTFDFVMELLSYGPTVKVLEPEFLRETVKEKLKSALSLYD